jgi:AbrB family looped-hinge helix DNA binding protein
MAEVFYSKVTSKGQTTIPMEIRKRMGLEEGSTIKYSFREGGDVVMEKDSLMTLIDKGVRFFYLDNQNKYYEIYPDKSRNEVDRYWLLEQEAHNLERNFHSVVISETQLECLREALKQETFIPIVNAEAVKLYYYLGLISVDEFEQYHEKKRIRDQR